MGVDGSDAPTARLPDERRERRHLLAPDVLQRTLVAVT